jgi:hypothetical protein
MERATSILALVGAGICTALQLVKDPQDAELIVQLQRQGWLEGSSVQVAGYGFNQPHMGSVQALDALQALVSHLGPMSLDQLAESRPKLLRRLQHQGAIETAKLRNFIIPTTT